VEGRGKGKEEAKEYSLPKKKKRGRTVEEFQPSMRPDTATNGDKGVEKIAVGGGEK